MYLFKSATAERLLEVLPPEATLLAQFMSIPQEELEQAIVSSTKASFGGGSYRLELAPDFYRVQYSGDFGNFYDSPGIIVEVPKITDEEWEYYEQSLDPDSPYSFDFSEYLEVLVESVAGILLETAQDG